MADTRDPYGVPLDDFISEIQPASVVGRRSGEHWLGDLYARKISPRITRWLIRRGATAMATTYAMMFIGLLGAGLIALPGVLPTLIAALAMQTYLVLDCSDGEIARWTKSQTAAGVYVDRVGHYVTEAAVFVALGLRAEGSFSIGTWTYVGALTAVFVILSKAETDLVTSARAAVGLGPLADTEPATDRGIRKLRSIVHRTRIHRILGAIEMSLLVLGFSIVDAFNGTIVATRILAATALVVGALLVVAHFLSIVMSDRLTRDR